jgi:tetratricopeptide (TPR) repeat protein
MTNENPIVEPFGERQSAVSPTPAPGVAPAASTGKVGPKVTPSKHGKVTGVFDAAITTSLVALFFGLPIFFTGFAFQGLVFEKQVYFYVWLLVALVAWVSKGVVTGEMKVRRTPLDIPIIAFVVVYGLSAALSIDRWRSFWGAFGDPSRGFLSVAGLALAYFLIMSHFDQKRLRLMFGGLVTSSFLLVIWSFFGIMGIRVLPASMEAYAPLSLIGTMTTLTFFLSVALPVFLTALFLLFDSAGGSRAWKIVGGVLVAIAVFLDLFLLLALSSFVSWPILIGGLGFLLIYILAQIVRPSASLSWIPMVMFVAVLAFLMIGSVRIARVSLPTEVIPKLSFAFDIAKSAVSDRFLLGAGPASYSSVFSQYRPVEYNQNALFTLRFDQAPGLFLEALSTIGALGTIAFLVLCLSFMSVGTYLLSNDRSRNKVLSLGLMSASLMFFIGSFISAFNGPLVLIGALVATLTIATLLLEGGTEERYFQLSLKASPKFALALAFIFMVVSAGVAFLFVFLGKALVADVAAGAAARSQEMETAAAGLSRAEQLNPREARYAMSLGQAYVALANREAAKPEGERSADQIAAFVRGAVVQAELASRLAPESVLVAESLGLVYENGALYASDALPKATEAYQKALALEPNSPILLVKLGQVKRSIGDQLPEGQERTDAYREAKDRFTQAIEKKGDFGIAHYNLSVVLSRLKEYDSAIVEASAADKLEPTNTTYRYGLGSLYHLRKGDGDLDKAEAIYQDILKSNEKFVDVRLALGLLYEERGDDTKALAEYRTIVTLLPEGESGDTLRQQIEVFIDAVQSGKGNISKAVPPAAPAPSTPAVPAPEQQATPVAPETVPAPKTPVTTKPAL